MWRSTPLPGSLVPPSSLTLTLTLTRTRSLTRTDQVKLSRQNVVTIVKGTRESGLTERELTTSVTRQERKTGDFTMTFRIPEQYQRKWDSAVVDNGVLIIRYLPDNDEIETEEGL